MSAWNANKLLIALLAGAIATESFAQEPPQRPKADGPFADRREPGEGERGRRRPPGPGRGPAGGGERRPGELPDDVQYFPPGPGFNPDVGRRPPGPHLPPHEWQRLEEDDPEMYALMVEDGKLEGETLASAGRLRRSKGEEREKIRSELEVVVARHFAARQKRRELQLKRMEEEIQRLREAIAARHEAREKIVAERIQQLIGEDDPLDF